MSENVIKTRNVIIGSGPAGYTAAIYASRAALEPVLIEGPQLGGQLTTTSEVENFPGYPEGVDGNQLMDDLRKQALRFGTKMISGKVTSVNFANRPFELVIDNGNACVLADSVIIATGAAARYLGLADEQKFMGMGVSACAVCDGFFYRKKTVAVVGGGDTACEEALYLSKLAEKVYLIVRKNYLRASKVMQKRVLDNPQITVLFNTNTTGLFGEEVLEGAHLIEFVGTPEERTYDIAIDGFFLAIGRQPNSGVFASYIETDEAGFIKTKPHSTATNIPGVFAAGDVSDPLFQQAIAAAGSGCRAALEAERFLLNND
ncbi:MAG: thioredoxin-disulfide reductase [Muribaculaceae bacterium]|nr:thioredoxin-disulfide reductase [Muribaculaceae bacterium]